MLYPVLHLKFGYVFPSKVPPVDDNIYLHGNQCLQVCKSLKLLQELIVYKANLLYHTFR